MNPYFNYPITQDTIGIARHQKGVLLFDMAQDNYELLIKYQDFLNMPYSIYLLDAKGATVQINDFGARICGFNTPEEAIDKTIFDVSKGDTSKVLLDNCQSVFDGESVQIFDEFNLRHDGHSLQFLSIKFPCYDASQQLQGTLGISVVLGENSLAEAITQLTNLVLLPQATKAQDNTIRFNLGDVILTPREQECLEYTVKGYTAKEIAKQLSISPRTVEDYINQVKSKLGVPNKQQMIQKVFQETH